MNLKIKSTTIIGVRHGRQVAIAGDGQVTFGEMSLSKSSESSKI